MLLLPSSWLNIVLISCKIRNTVRPVGDETLMPTATVEEAGSRYYLGPGEFREDAKTHLEDS